MDISMQSKPLRLASRLEAPVRLARLAAGLLLCGAAAMASAQGNQSAPTATGDAAPAGDPLVVSLDHVVPEYQAGAKFRSPPTIDTALAEDLAKRLGRPLEVTGPVPVAALAAGEDAGARADLRITTLADARPPDSGLVTIALDYRAAPMAIMRSDSDLRRWEHLRDRKVCVAEGGNHVGDSARRYGAVEIVHPSVTDALVALRIGDCDVMVHDSVMLEELIRFPEWRKFSRRLPPRPRGLLAVLVPEGDAATATRVQAVVDQWKEERLADALVKNAVRNIAFEVYLEQDVPDCH